MKEKFVQVQESPELVEKSVVTTNVRKRKLREIVTSVPQLFDPHVPGTVQCCGSESGWTRSFWQDPEPSSSGSEMKFKFLFVKQNIPLKSLYLVTMCNLTHTKQEYKGKIYAKNIRKNSCTVVSEKRSGSETN
jgi:hypothetical protein